MRARRSLPALPEINNRTRFQSLVRKLSAFIIQAIDLPQDDWNALGKEVYATSLRPLVKHLVDDVSHPAIVSALLASRWHFAVIEDDDDKALNETRALACELVAWRFVTHLTQREAIDFLCYDLPSDVQNTSALDGSADGDEEDADFLESATNEEAPLLESPEEPGLGESFHEDFHQTSEDTEEVNYTERFAGLNALEIATLSDAKKFLAQKTIQRIIDGIWKGDIVFWETLSTHSTKQAKLYRKNHADPYCRLRVPLYLKMFEVLFFALFLVFYYIVLVQKASNHVTGIEVVLYIWLASFAYNEFNEATDAGLKFYATDFWSLWDLGIIATGIAFFVVRMVALSRHDQVLREVAFDILSVEALFLVPRICSLLSLHPYFGMLIPALKEMTKDFIKFLGLVAILYVGFTTTFVFLARGTFSLLQMNWILIKVFFGSSYLGFDVAEEISPILGPPLMFVFVCMTNILLITSLISLLSNTLAKVQQRARDEFLFGYAVFVLESTTSNRLTYFLPPLNLIPLLLLRPLRLVLPAQLLRQARIVLLKATHWPFVAFILGYESGRLYLTERRRSRPGIVSPALGRYTPTSLRRPLSSKARAVSRPPLLDEEPRGVLDGSVQNHSAVAETLDDLPAVVESLKVQIEALSSLVARQTAQTSKGAGQ